MGGVQGAAGVRAVVQEVVMQGMARGQGSAGTLQLQQRMSCEEAALFQVPCRRRCTPHHICPCANPKMSELCPYATPDSFHLGPCASRYC